MLTGTTSSWGESRPLPHGKSSHPRVGDGRDDGLGMAASTMRQLADALGKLAEVGVHVTSFSFGGYVMHVTRHDDQREGAWYTLDRIEKAAVR